MFRPPFSSISSAVLCAMVRARSVIARNSLRTMYGHWTAVVRRSRLGLLLALGTDADGDLLGEVLPRRTPISARRGLAWLIDADGRRLVQVAVDPPAGSV